MADKPAFEKFFDHHCEIYMDNIFTKDTAREAAFLIEELNLPKGSSLLDIGCGTGRHAVEMARYGFKVTGVDLSTGMLNKAREAAEKAGVELTLIHADATKFETDKQFDAAICLCEGAFCLLSLDEDPHEHDMAILRNISNALKPSGRLIMTALSALKKIREFSAEDIKSGKFDPWYIIEKYEMEYDTPEGKKSVEVRERGYVASELRLMLKQAGFEVENIWGGTAGNWGRRPIDLDEWELMVVARKK